jgi:hypothetical protein
LMFARGNILPRAPVGDGARSAPTVEQFLV